MPARSVPPRPAMVFVGSVESSAVALAALLAEGGDVRGVFGLAETAGRRATGYRRLDEIAAAHSVPYADFAQINDPATVDRIARLTPDLIWIVGLSQLVGPPLREAARLGCIGFHPTRLPQGRGRAALAWSILADVPLAATFFLIDDGVDAGPILAQVDIQVTPVDDLPTRYRKVYDAIPAAVAAVCRQIAAGELCAVEQDEAAATFLGTRKPADGAIDWREDSAAILRQVRASAAPHPGAWTSCGDTEVRIAECRAVSARRFVGVPGRILVIGPAGFVVATGDGALEVTAFAADRGWQPAIGLKLGVTDQVELFRLRRRVRALETMVARLTEHLGIAAGPGGDRDGA